jgi:hypothetical protein
MPEAENLDLEALWTEAATCNRKPKSGPEVRDWQIIASDLLQAMRGGKLKRLYPTMLVN